MKTYVVVYDVDQGDDVASEEYYGYFSSPEEAVSMYKDMISGHEATHTNARVCLVVFNIPDGGDK